jgi:hypothetical protein
MFEEVCLCSNSKQLNGVSQFNQLSMQLPSTINNTQEVEDTLTSQPNLQTNSFLGKLFSEQPCCPLYALLAGCVGFGGCGDRCSCYHHNSKTRWGNNDYNYL